MEYQGSKLGAMFPLPADPLEPLHHPFRTSPSSGSRAPVGQSPPFPASSFCGVRPWDQSFLETDSSNRARGFDNYNGPALPPSGSYGCPRVTENVQVEDPPVTNVPWTSLAGPPPPMENYYSQFSTDSRCDTELSGAPSTLTDATLAWHEQVGMAGHRQVSHVSQDTCPEADDDIAPPAPFVVSAGSTGHPDCCGAPCKYVRRKTGCQDGVNCKKCHLCQWRRGCIHQWLDARSRPMEGAPLRSQKPQAHVAPAPEMVAKFTSEGTVGHPQTCATPCKYLRRKGGCRNGAQCPNCHLCQWMRGLTSMAMPSADRVGERRSMAADGGQAAHEMSLADMRLPDGLPAFLR